MNVLRRLELSDMDAAARIHRSAFDDALPWLAGLHTPEKDQWFFHERVFPACEVWGAWAADELIGIVAFRRGLDRSALRVAKGAAQRDWNGVVAHRAAVMRPPFALDVPAQHGGAPFLRGEGIQADPGNRRRGQ